MASGIPTTRKAVVLVLFCSAVPVWTVGWAQGWSPASAPTPVTASESAFTASFPINVDAYAALADSPRLMLGDLSLGGGLRVSLDLPRVHAFAPDALRTASDGGGERMLASPPVALFGGPVAGSVRGRAFVSVSPYGVYGFVDDGREFVLISSGPAESGLPALSINLARMPEDAIVWAEYRCAFDELLANALQTLPAGPLDVNGGGVAGTSVPCRRVWVAVDTDFEYLGLFAGSEGAANAYLETLFGAVSEIYTRDLNTRIVVVYSRLWTTSNDPWNASSTSAQLTQFQNYWSANMGHVGRHLAHFISGRTLGGGVAYLNAICGGNGYGLSANMRGSFPYPIQHNHSQNWDLMVVSHEIGHNFGAPHTHDMSPRVDNCAGGDCSVVPNATIMSYCHQCPGGMANVRMEFHPRSIDEYMLPTLGFTETSCNIRAEIEFSDQPDSAVLSPGQDFTLQVVVTGAGPVSYQWRRNGVPLADDGRIINSQTGTMTIHTVQVGDTGVYDCVATNFCDSFTSASATLTICTANEVLFVKRDATGAGDGASWANAMTDLNSALAVASLCPGVSEVWVAAGVYKPTPGSDRAATIQLRSGVAILGGFAGNESLPAQRNPLVNLTVLSGDLAGDDAGLTNNGENSYQVVTGSGTNATAVLDGFVIRGGNANLNPGGGDPRSNGGGLFVNDGGPTIANCVFEYNAAANSGGGAALLASTGTTLTGCSFRDNAATATGGGGLFVSGGTATVTACAFNNNTSGERGGAAKIDGNATITVGDCSFSANAAPSTNAVNGGGAIYTGAGNVRIVRGTFLVNTSGSDGGAIRSGGGGSVLVLSSSFAGNTSTDDGGGVYADGSTNLTVANGVFSGNRATGTGGVGGGLTAAGAVLTLVNSTFSGNSAGQAGGGVRTSGSTVKNIRNCAMWGNTAPGGTQISTANTAPTVTYSVVQGGFTGTGNANVNPLFVDADGADNLVGTADDDLRLSPGSPAIDRARNSDLPADAADLDGDGNTAEPLPLDFAGAPRLVDDCATNNTGIGTPPVDSGAFEFEGTPPPVITTPPADATRQVGQSVTFSVSASGLAPLSYQWRRNGAALADDARISGATATSLTISGLLAADAGSYDVVVSNGCGSTISAAAALTVNPLYARGDCNCDGSIDNFDIDAFLVALLDPAGYATLYPGCDRNLADVNIDGAVDNFDIDPFVALVTQ
ncbi:MAG: immunoglobulin domain-containing protein [Phycisphaerae bacterium]